MTSTKVFDDGSVLRWKDKETLEYTEGEYVLLVWVDFMPGFFSSGRILKSESLESWTLHPKATERIISDKKKGEIIDKVISYYRDVDRKCVVE